MPTMIDQGSVEYYDVIIVGGGVAGCSTALSLVRRNPDTSVLVLDNADTSLFKIGTALPEDANQVLSYLAPQLPMELLQDMSETDPILTRSTANACSWSGPDLLENRALNDGSGIGWHLNRSHFDEILRDLVVGLSEKNKRVSLCRGTFLGIERIDEGQRWAILTRGMCSRQEKVYSSKWVVDATGRDATVAHKLGARTVKFDNLTAYYGLFIQIPKALRADPDHRSIIEASDNGWWYTAQTPNRPNNIRIVIYYTDESDPSARYAKTQNGFLKLLFRGTFHIARLLTKFQYTLAPGIGGEPPSSSSSSTTSSSSSAHSKSSLIKHSKSRPNSTPNPIYQIPAGSSHLTSCCNSRNGPQGDGARWCAVGDAAAAVDPLASQGIVTSMKMGSFVGDVVGKELRIQVEMMEMRMQRMKEQEQMRMEMRMRQEQEQQEKEQQEKEQQEKEQQEKEKEQADDVDASADTGANTDAEANTNTEADTDAEAEAEAEVEEGDKDMDKDTDKDLQLELEEEEKLYMSAAPLDPTDKIPVVTAQMRYKNEKEKVECYRQVGRRFQGEFWGKRR